MKFFREDEMEVKLTDKKINVRESKLPKYSLSFTTFTLSIHLLLARYQQSLLLIMRNRLDSANLNHTAQNSHPNYVAFGEGDE